MSFGNNVGGFPPQPGPFAGGYRTPAGPGAVGAEETWFEAEVPFAGAPLPPRCACCFGPVEVHRAASATVTVGRTHYTRRMEIPYCRACEVAVKEGARRGRLQGFLGLGVAAVFPLLLSLAWLYAPAAVTFVATPVVALGALLLLAKLWPTAPIARHRGATSGNRDAVWMLPFHVGQNPTRLAGTNETWMRQLGEMHRTVVTPRGRRRTRDARYIVVPIVATLLAIPTWFGLHGRVYFDNPTTSPLTFDIDHGLAEVTVAPNGHEDLYLPAGEAVIDVMFDGRAVDRISADIEHFGKHLASPFGRACYATLSTAYGDAVLDGPRRQMAPAGQRWHTLHRVQSVLEPFPRSVSVGRGQRGAIRVRFTRVHCITGAPML
ncbi:MAG: hypothetical protein IPF99_29690 [Deltaproteobacteria bacterium]|nr:hypothetical protein [Deltaproteobacteria bacterium]